MILVDDVPFAAGYAHPICPLGERLDNKLLIRLSPISDPHIRTNDGANILDDVFRLPSFIVKRDSTGRQRFYNSQDVDFGATGDTYVKILERKFDKLLHEIEYHFPGGWHTKSVGTFIQRVHNDVGWVVIGQYECLLEALYQDVTSRLVRAVVMIHVYAVEYIAAKIGASRELGKKGKDQVSTILFIGIPEVEVIVSH